MESAAEKKRREKEARERAAQRGANRAMHSRTTPSGKSRNKPEPRSGR